MLTVKRNIIQVSFCLSFVFLISLTPARAFIPSRLNTLNLKADPKRSSFRFANKKEGAKQLPSSSSMTMMNILGPSNIANAVSTALQKGPFGIPALTAVAATVLTPLTLYRQAYSFSVAYGYSMAAMGATLLLSFPGIPSITDFMGSKSPSFWLTSSLIFYGLRLGSFLLIRNVFVKSKADKFEEMDKTPKLKRIPFALNVAIFYAFLASPAMYVLRGGMEGGKLLWTGVYTAWAGAILEAVADTHKFITKRGKDGAVDFAGPTGGLYAISRHPSYLFELMYWYGLHLGGTSSFGMNPVAWICSTLGIAGITFIMTNATGRLDKQQEERYGGQKSYELWKKNVPYTLVPFLK